VFCVIQAASAGRLLSLPKSDLLIFNKKKVTQDVIEGEHGQLQTNLSPIMLLENS
jgi:hypothetical protein